MIKSLTGALRSVLTWRNWSSAAGRLTRAELILWLDAELQIMLHELGYSPIVRHALVPSECGKSKFSRGPMAGRH